MRRSDLNPGDEVAVYPTTPVPTDPYARIFRDSVKKGVVVDVTGEDGVDVEFEGAEGHTFNVVSRQVVGLWDTWTVLLADRNVAAHRQSDRMEDKLEAERKALSKALAEYPTARIEDHCVVIPIEDWLAHG